MAPAARQGRSNPFLPLLQRVQKRVEPQLLATLRAAEAGAQSPEVGSMIAALTDLCARGGKRLRPALCVAGAHCVQDDPEWDVLLSAGVALELLQAYFLVHDDWMDGDDERRGGPTVHVALSKILGSAHLGASSAILAGDFAVSLAQSQLAHLPAPAARVRKAMAVFADMQLAAVAGQQLDIVAREVDPELTYELKTASYTVKGPLLLGAELAGAKKNCLNALESYSRPAGIGFQLRDDLIGVFGDPRQTGKPRGADLTAGKNTSLVKEGRARLAARDRKSLEAVLTNRQARRAQVERVVQQLDECGARGAVEARIAELESQAKSALDTSDITPAGKKLLVGAVTALCHRTS